MSALKDNKTCALLEQYLSCILPGISGFDTGAQRCGTAYDPVVDTLKFTL